MLRALLIAIGIGYATAPLAQPQSNVSTPKGSTVTAHITPELSNADRAYRDQMSSSPNRTLIQYFNDGYSASGRFNCHGYAWHMAEGGPARWIGLNFTTDEDIYMTDGSYVRVCNETYPGKVSWVANNHSAITTATPGRWRSKWGNHSLVEHHKDDTPYGTGFAYYVSTNITGSTTNLCTGSRTFSMQSISGATYSWTKSSTLSVIGATNTNQIAVQRNGSSNGAAWVEVQVSTPCSATPATRRINFTVGAPALPSISGPAQITCYDYPCFQLTGVVPGDNIQWQHPANWSMVTGANTSYFCAKPPSVQSPTMYQIVAGVSNACGTQYAIYYITVNPCDYSYSVSPNPATANVTVTPKQNTKATARKTITEINIYDQMGNLKKRFKPGKVSTASLDVSGLQAGLYFIEIIDGAYKERQQLSIRQ